MALASMPAAHACGPEFPNTFFSAPDAEILASPEGAFAQEIARLPVPAFAPPAAVPASAEGQESMNTLLQDVADLRTALEGQHAPAERIRSLCEAYEKARLRFAPAPKGLPEEFARYYAGGVAWHENRTADARKEWCALLDMPEADRRFRSVWAAYMLGRLEQQAAEQGGGRTESAKAASWFRQARAFTANGHPDTLGLAAASYGWEAKIALVEGRFPEAFHLYRLHYVSGCTSSALVSLRWTARRALDADAATLATLARDELSRRVLTAYLISLGGGDLYDDNRETFTAKAAAWAEVLANSGLRDMPDVDRLAWVAYEGGRFALAEQWAALAPENCPAAEWIRAKLALRKGDLSSGETRLRSALAGDTLSEDQRARVFAELGRVCLSENRPGAALEAWMKGGHWQDAAYAAEHVLSLDELQAYVDADCPSSNRPPAYGASRGTEQDQLPLRLRHLLARRLARANKVESAERYFPDDLRTTYASYVADVRSGFDLGQTDANRAAAFWRAARILREHGMELIGTELEPDWAIWDGNYSLDPTASQRRDVSRLTGSLFAPTSDEIARIDATPTPERRFHYRFRAAELAWCAASLLPNDLAETANILCTAGRWIAQRDPQFADRFYQALVIRCGRTDLGRAAAAKRWFPSDDEAKPL